MAAPSMDLATFLGTCDGRGRKIITMKFEGQQQIAMAAEFGISPPVVCLRPRAQPAARDAGRAGVCADFSVNPRTRAK